MMEMSERSESSSTRRRKIYQAGNNYENPLKMNYSGEEPNSTSSTSICSIMTMKESPSSTSSHTSVSAFMVDDKHYLQYLKHGTIPGRHKKLSKHLDDVKCAKGCASFSLVGIIFLVRVVRCKVNES